MNHFLSNCRTRGTRLFSFATLMLVGISVPSVMGQSTADAPVIGTQIIETQKETWRSATIFTHAIWNDMLFYGGGSGSDGGDPRHEIEIGVFHLAKTRANEKSRDGSHDPRNPIVTRSQFGLDKPGKGITPLSILEVSGTLYMFCTARPDDDLQPRIVVITASVEQPLKWSKLSVVIDRSVSGCQHNHGASAMINPDNTSEVLVYFAACTPPKDYRILLASVPIDKITEKQCYTLLRSYDQPVLKRENAKANYPFIRYDMKQQQYELWYSGHTRPGSRTRSCFVATSKRKDSFQPAKVAIVQPSAKSDRDDNVYATGPKWCRGRLYYSGRRETGGTYRGIFELPAAPAQRHR